MNKILTRRGALARTYADATIRIAADAPTGVIYGLAQKATLTVHKPSPGVASLHTGDDHMRLLRMVAGLARRTEAAEGKLRAIRKAMK